MDPDFHFVAGNLALDFANTVANRLSADLYRDDLQTPADVRRWAQMAGLATVPHIDLQQIRTTRENLYAIFRAMVHGKPIPSKNLQAIDAALRNCRAKQRLIAGRAGIHWAWTRASGTERILYPILLEAADLLTSDAQGSIQECAGAGCGWLFLDRSHARKRKWCRMADCGNRAKARKHYLRHG